MENTHVYKNFKATTRPAQTVPSAPVNPIYNELGARTGKVENYLVQNNELTNSEIEILLNQLVTRIGKVENYLVEKNESINSDIALLAKAICLTASLGTECEKLLLGSLHIDSND